MASKRSEAMEMQRTFRDKPDGIMKLDLMADSQDKTENDQSAAGKRGLSSQDQDYDSGMDGKELPSKAKTPQSLLVDAIHALRNGSHKERLMLLHHCLILYECKECANLFRRAPDFLNHKRSCPAIGEVNDCGDHLV